MIVTLLPAKKVDTSKTLGLMLKEDSSDDVALSINKNIITAQHVRIMEILNRNGLVSSVVR